MRTGLQAEVGNNSQAEGASTRFLSCSGSHGLFQLMLDQAALPPRTTFIRANIESLIFNLFIQKKKKKKE